MSRVKICPKCGAIAEWDSYFGGTRCTRCDFVEKPKPSHADRIRAKSDEELAKWISKFAYCTECPVRVDGLCSFFKSYEWCADHWLEWLKKEADNG